MKHLQPYTQTPQAINPEQVMRRACQRPGRSSRPRRARRRRVTLLTGRVTLFPGLPLSAP